MSEEFEFRDKQLSDTDPEIEARLRPQIFSDFVSVYFRFKGQVVQPPGFNCFLHSFRIFIRNY